jgi:hypothetical protein
MRLSSAAFAFGPLVAAVGSMALMTIAFVTPVPAAQPILDQDPQIAEAFSEVSLPLPSPDQIIFCHGYGCKFRTAVALSAADHTRLAAIMAPGKASAEAERRSAAAAVAWFDRLAGPMAGTSNHLARAGVAHAGESGQLDCIDSSRNTMSVLMVLDDLKLLRHHRVDAPVARGFLLDGKAPHVTAVLAEQRSARQWAVDSWTRPGGQPPEVVPLDRWMDMD